MLPCIHSIFSDSKNGQGTVSPRWKTIRNSQCDAKHQRICTGSLTLNRPCLIRESFSRISCRRCRLRFCSCEGLAAIWQQMFCPSGLSSRNEDCQRLYKGRPHAPSLASTCVGQASGSLRAMRRARLLLASREPPSITSLPGPKRCRAYGSLLCTWIEGCHLPVHQTWPVNPNYTSAAALGTGGRRQ